MRSTLCRLVSLTALAITATAQWTYDATSCKEYTERVSKAVPYAALTLSDVTDRLSPENREKYPLLGTALADFFSDDSKDVYDYIWSEATLSI